MRGKRRLELVAVDAEVVGDESEPVAEDAETVVEDFEVVEEEVVAKPGRYPQTWREILEEAEKWWVLPETLGALARAVNFAAFYGQCLVELRERLRKAGVLTEERKKLLDKEIRHVRVKLYVYGARLLSLIHNTPCHMLSHETLRQLCEWMRAFAPPKYVGREIVRGNPGAENPGIILSLMKMYLPQCYNKLTAKDVGPVTLDLASFMT